MSQQIAAIAASEAKPTDPCAEDVFAYLMEQGTGKSKVILDEWGEWAVNGGPPDLLVIAPAGSYRNWYEDKSDFQKSELNTHLDPDFRDRLAFAGWTGGGSKNREQLRKLLAVKDKKRPRALFMNVEAFSRVEKAVDLAREFIGQRHTFMVVDESTTIKGKSKRTKNIVELGEAASSRRILSGLWTPKSPMDAYYQAEFLSPDILQCRSWYSFRARYAVLRKMEFGGRAVQVIVGYRNIDDLKDRMKPYSYRALKSECLDLDDKVYTSRDVELTETQKRMYREMREYATMMIGGGSFVTANQVITQIIRMQQLNCGYVVDDNRILQEVDENRTKALLEVLNDHQGKAIIWAPFDFAIRRIVDALKKEYGENSVAAFWGGNVKVRGQEEKRFLGDPECRFMVSTPASGGRGNTWTVADLTVYYANNYDLEQRAQSEDRNHRKGQTKKVTYVDLIARGTVDEKIVSALRKKINMATMITGENYREWLI